jgi:hypothetical protein
MMRRAKPTLIQGDMFMKHYWRTLGVWTLALAASSQAQTLDDGPVSVERASKAPQALLVAVPENKDEKTIVVPFKNIDGLEINDALDIEKNQNKISGVVAEYLETLKQDNKKPIDVLRAKALQVSALPNENASSLKGREAWFSFYYRPRYSWYNPWSYGWGSSYYYSWARPVYNYWGYNYYYYPRSCYSSCWW